MGGLRFRGREHRRGERATADEEERGRKRGTTISTRNSPTMDDAREIKKRKKEKKTEVCGGFPLCCSWATEGQPSKVVAFGKGLQQP